MIADNQTNTVYISNLWPEEDPQRFYELEALIKKSWLYGKASVIHNR